jgi:hypothetical protein
MADDILAAELAAIRERNEGRIKAMLYTERTVKHHVAEGDVRRLLAALHKALSFHRRVPLYGNAATEEELGACPHDPDSGLHFESGDGDWLCEGKPEGSVCSTCVDGEGGERVEWPCGEYLAILAALTGEGKADG